MLYREANVTDIVQLHLVRTAVKENALSNPDLVTQKDYEAFLTVKGKGWLCETENKVAGFCIISLQDKNVWALFVHPNFEGKGIGRQLHFLMLDWYFKNTAETIWLSTAPGTRAATFYRQNGWTEVGMYGKELKFELPFAAWQQVQKRH